MKNAGFLTSVRKDFTYYKSLGDRSLAQVPEADLFRQLSPADNSLATIVKHLWGNMLSRWTDFLDSDGEKSWRNREAEFENDIESKREMEEKWEEGWRVLLKTLDGLSDDDLTKTVYIRNQGHTVFQAITRQLAHYASHVGQIVFLAKHLTGEDWESLSIPKGQSEAFNKARTEKKEDSHYSEDNL